jgi:Protein of unknown function (DUF3645)
VQDLLALRGLLAHDVLIHCLSLRHGEHYGVVSNHKTMMAIPFQAANLPKLRSEFAQQDTAIMLTVLSYYNIGLTRGQVVETVTVLLSIGKSLQKRIYDEIFNLSKMGDEENYHSLSSIDSIDKLDVGNEIQVDLLYQVYRKNMAFINFWLGYVLFPIATMVFPEKMTASSWNLTDCRKSSLQCGFSGTDDACLLLPHPLSYDPPEHPSVLATYGKMLEYLINKSTFSSLPGVTQANEYGLTLSGVGRVMKPTACAVDESISLIQLASMALTKDASALIDAGALLCNYAMELVAEYFLKQLPEKFLGIVYFSVHHSSWRVLDRKHAVTNLTSSPISERDAFVIYDQNRCRGADMKLRRNAVAILSIGPRQRKDALLQAAGRLRQLDFGQTIIVTAPASVENLVRECLGLPKNHTLTMKNVVSYTLINSVEATGNSLKHWSHQGLRFLTFVNNPKSILEEEKSDLVSFMLHQKPIAIYLMSFLQNWILSGENIQYYVKQAWLSWML